MSPETTLFVLAKLYVARCCELETPPRVSELAAMLELSASTLARRFRQEHEEQLAAVLKDLQLEHAKRMLLESSLSTTRIAYACGFGTRRTFFRAFQRAEGMTPTSFRARRHECPHDCPYHGQN